MNDLNRSPGDRPPNDRTAEFVRLLSQHDSQLSAYVHALIPVWSDAEDIVQETNVRLWEQFDRYEPGTNFGAWARTIARYMVLACRKRKSRDRLFFSEDVLDLVGAEVERVSEQESDDRRRLLFDCLEKVSVSNRKLLASCYAERANIKELARNLGRTVNSIYLALSRTRRWLRDCVERKLAEEQGS